MNFYIFQVYLHDVNVSADVWEAVDTERGGLRERSSLDSKTKKKMAVFCCPLSWREKGTVCA